MEDAVKAQQKILIIGAFMFVFSMTLVICSHKESMKKLDVQLEEYRSYDKQIVYPPPIVDPKKIEPYKEIEPVKKKCKTW